MLLAACASTPTVSTDTDPQGNFAGYRTFRWIQPPQDVSPLLAQRIVAGVNSQLVARGWSEAADADVAIAAHVAKVRIKAMAPSCAMACQVGAMEDSRMSAPSCRVSPATSQRA
ncbi:DUF4136 domain-containing protein [Luteimonas cucumeris]|uniref:DUF4136 domain-containing protein n=1 Tax=Luteimonas cucumeris TaxID=985012 RepID=UPI001A7EDB83